MTIQNVLASAAVRDPDAAVAWYERLRDRPADSRPMPEVSQKLEVGSLEVTKRADERAHEVRQRCHRRSLLTVERIPAGVEVADHDITRRRKKWGELFDSNYSLRRIRCAD